MDEALSGLVALAVLLAGAVVAMLIRVVLGWLQHVLTALLDNADSTSAEPAPAHF